MNRTVCVLFLTVLLVCGLVTGCPKKPVGAPNANFSADVTTGTVPLSVQFADESTANNSPILTWHWLFGDGAESFAQNPAHVYTTVGTYNVSLEVTAASGGDTELKLNYVTVTEATTEGEPEFETEIILLPGNVPLEMVLIPAGNFTMGSPLTESSHEYDEEQHVVTLDAFWMGKYELTQAQWKALMGGANPSSFAGVAYGDTDNRPVETVPWNGIESFLTALNAHIASTAQGAATMRLPSESEWEYACRGGEHVPPTRFYWGDDLYGTEIGNHAWHSGNSASQTHDVGVKSVNPFGLYDICGNVREWVQDWYHDTYIGAPTDGSAWEVPPGTDRIVRGGSWYTGVSGHRSAYRTYRDPSVGYSYVGFRVVRQ